MTKIDDNVKRRFAELFAQGQTIRLTGSRMNHAEHATFYAWAVSAMNIVKGVFGKDSPHYVHFAAELESVKNNFVDSDRLQSFRGMFAAAKSDLDGGYVFDVAGRVTGEIFGDFVVAAKAALSENNYTVAAVLACAALEDALKRYATSNDLDVTDKTMEEVISALKSKGLVSGAQKSLLSAMPKIRNHAMHAQWEKLTPQDAGSVIGFVEQFLLTHFP